MNSYTFRVPVIAYQDATVEAATQEEAERMLLNYLDDDGIVLVEWSNIGVDGIDYEKAWDGELSLVAKSEEAES